jgi:hypothetical protein
MTRLEKLLMRVELIDKVTAPVNKIMGTMDKLTKSTATGFAHMAGGAAGLFGVGYAMQSLTSDSREMHRAVGEVASLSVAGDVLKNLEKTAIGFSIRYGESAADFVRSSYDIQSAIAGLVGNELGVFTNASNVLAKATKADAGTITNYMGTMYGIFKGQADSMGKAKWVEQLTGQTAQAVEMFKTNGVQMSGAFTSLGADATAHGIAINEQMAVLGKLQATMSGSEAGTKYKAFLRGVGGAQEKLGMQFTDSAGKMLPVDQILSKLQGKFGAIDTVAKSDMLKKAFGSDEAVAAIKLLISDTGGLTNSIETLGNVRGMDKARAMAEKMVDPMERVNAVSTAVKIGFGKLIQNAMMPFYDAVIENGSVLTGWIDKYPHLFGALAKLTVIIFGVVAVVSLLAIAKGAAIITIAAFNTAVTILKTPLYIVRAATWAWRTALILTRAAVLATAISLPGLLAGLVAMKAGFVSGATSAWAFAAALFANPITWIVLGVVALIAGLVLLVRNWDAVSAAAGRAITWMVEKWQSFRAIIEDNPVLKFIFQPLLLAADFVGFLITNLDKIPAWFTTFKTFLSGLDPFAIIGEGIDWLIQKLNLIPGVNIETRMNNTAIANTGTTPDRFSAGVIPTGAPPAISKAAEPFSMTAPVNQATKTPAQPIPQTLQKIPQPVPVAVDSVANNEQKIEHEREQIAPPPAAPVRNVPAGGLMQQFNNSNTQNRGNTIGTLNVNTTQAVNGYSLNDQLLMAGG